jgi:hypothetical protein
MFASPLTLSKIIYMTERYPSKELEHAKVITKVIELASTGELANDLLTSRWRSSHEDVEWILTSLIDPSAYKCSVIIKYTDQTSFNVSWQDGRIWSLTHTDTKYKDNPDRVIPFTNSLPRLGYVFGRVITPVEEASAALNLHNILDNQTDSKNDNSVAANNKFMEYLNKRTEDPEFQSLREAFSRAFLDIDPADIDANGLYQPILDINPASDRLPLYLPDSKS